MQNKLPTNEPIYSYAPQTKEREELKATLSSQRKNSIEIPLIIGGKEIFTKETTSIREPHLHSSQLAKCSQATREHTEAAIKAAEKAKPEWENMPMENRAAIFQRAAELLAGKYRPILNAATMLGQSKSAYQAEIDSACELIDFWRFNVHFMEKIHQEQPISVSGIENSMEYRALEGFVFAVTPFNFTAIGGNLPTAPAMMGNTVIWKPSATATLSNYYIMKILKEAGLPDGVINFLPGPSVEIAPPILKDKNFAGLHFTGSTPVFNSIWKTVSENLENYRSYPRLIGETGGKDFVFAHYSAKTKSLATALVRGAFEYQGQKCSAASRAYLPKSIWPEVRSTMEKQLSEIKMGDVCDFANFVNAVIDEKSFQKITGYLDRARKSSDCEIIAGGSYNKETGYFIEPTIILTKNPHYETMVEEIFGPVLTIFIYEDNRYEETLKICESSSPYALTGAFFAEDPAEIKKAKILLRYAAGNFYINDKPTGAVVAQQPFGGARASGTNDKAGSLLNLIRFTSPRTIKVNLEPPTDYRYPFMG